MINDNYSRLHVASNQILLNFSRMKSLGEPATKLEMAGQHRPQDPPQRVGRFELLVRRACVHPFIDTPSGSSNLHYVQQRVLELPPPIAAMINPGPLVLQSQIIG